MSRRLPGLLITSVTALALSACGGGGNGSEGATTTLAGLAANDHGTADVTGRTEISVELDDDYFDPTVVKGTPGQKVTLELENEGKAEHNFSIDGQGVDADVEPSEKKTVSVLVPDSGTLSFYCSYHKSKGMAGALEASGS